MSQHARELCAYLKELEDGPVYCTIWSVEGPPFWCDAISSPATSKARLLDFTVHDQVAAAIKYIRSRISQAV